MKKHKHKFKWQLAQMYGATEPSGMVKMCECGEMSMGIKEDGFMGVKVIKFGKFVPAES